MANHSSLLPHFSHWLFPVRPSIMISKTGVRSIRVFSMSMISSWSLAPSMNSSRVSSPAGSEVRIHNYIIKCLLNTAQTKMLKSEKLPIDYILGSRFGCRSDLQVLFINYLVHCWLSCDFGPDLAERSYRVYYLSWAQPSFLPSPFTSILSNMSETISSGSMSLFRVMSWMACRWRHQGQITRFSMSF